ncbi:uncharacterized protein LOC107474316 [Arachis duranensis]|uniref:Uncharacterized protein LOC107474316 n=1 Tax=Arachis duranensis TaxID=130453 RepID=A0A6P4CDU3_ARADU|nr:uncharacterized protein LOC107474316 [Arachis duranensis]
MWILEFHNCRPKWVSRRTGLAWKDFIDVKVLYSNSFSIAILIKDARKVVVVGVFNAIKSNEEKEGGHGFTWSNKRSGANLIKERLDRCLSTMVWREWYEKAVILVDGRLKGDLNSKIDCPEMKSKKNRGEGLGDGLCGSNNSRTNFKREFEEITKQLEEKKAEDNFGGNKVFELENKLKEELKKEGSYWREKARCKWLKEGDNDTKFFHRKSQSRNRKNKIWS